MQEGIGVGDEVFLTGLFVSHYGQRQNLPIVRVGNIALLGDEPVQTEDGPMSAYLVEARSIGGLSGSPVFVHLGLVRFLDGSIKHSADGRPFFWLGLMHGHWNIPRTEEDGAAATDQVRESMNTGIAIVVPAAKALEVINQPQVQEMRKRSLPEPLREQFETQDTAGSAELIPQTSDDEWKPPAPLDSSFLF